MVSRDRQKPEDTWVRKLSDKRISSSPHYGEIPCESTGIARPFKGLGAPTLRKCTTVDLAAV